MANRVTYAIGDVHGCRKRLDRLLQLCLLDAGEREIRLVFIGDYIDRGPDSRGTIERLISLQRERPGAVICLRGNHEVLLLEALATGEAAHWLVVNGGNTTLASYGVERLSALPPEHLAWIGALPASFDDGLRFFVHAGVNPDRPLGEQDEHDLVWMREPFLSTPRDYGRLIVHGHTPQRGGDPDVRSWRVNIDTAAVYGGRLTAAIFDDRQRAPLGFITDD